MSLTILIRGGGDLASGVALRLHHCGLQVLIAELPQPLVVRRWVSFAEAVFAGQVTVEDVTARRVDSLTQARSVWEKSGIPVLVDPDVRVLSDLRSSTSPSPLVLVDGRMTKKPPTLGVEAADLVIGLGPGFSAGENCHAAIETNRGHRLGRVLWQGAPEPDTGMPEEVGGMGSERVLRAPLDGILIAHAEIGDHLEAGQAVAEVSGQMVIAPFRGVLRGLLRAGLPVEQGLKIGDVDPRDDPLYCSLVSDKSLAVGGGVLEAILSFAPLRPFLWGEYAPG